MRALTGWAVAAAVGLTACGGSSAEEPRSLPTLASVAASPSPVANVPSEAAGETPQAAEAFARFVFSEIERAFRTKNPELVSRLSLPACKSCKLYVDSIARLRDMNETLTGGDFDVTYAASPGESAGVTSVSVTYNFSGATRTDSGGKVIRKEPAARGIQDEVDLKRVSGEWRVAAIRRVRVSGR